MPSDVIRAAVIVAEAPTKSVAVVAPLGAKTHSVGIKSGPSFGARKRHSLFHLFLIRLMCGPKNGPRFGARSWHHFWCRFLYQRCDILKKAVPYCGPNVAAESAQIANHILNTPVLVP